MEHSESLETFFHEAVDQALKEQGVATDPLTEHYLVQLLANYARFVEVLMLISRRIMPPTGPRDIIKLYEKWLQTRSGWAARRLAALGVFPQPGGSRLQ